MICVVYTNGLYKAVLCRRTSVKWIILVVLDTKASQSRIKAYCSLSFLHSAP